MTQTLEEIRDTLNTMPTTNEIGPLRSLVFDLCERVIDLEYRLRKAESTARSATNTAGCLANGIQPD